MRNHLNRARCGGVEVDNRGASSGVPRMLSASAIVATLTGGFVATTAASAAPQCAGAGTVHAQRQIGAFVGGFVRTVSMGLRHFDGS